MSNPHQSIARYLKPERVLLLDAGSKKEVLDTLIDRLSGSSKIKDAAAFSEGIWHREELMSTGIGLQIGVPHVRLPSVKDMVMAVAVNRDPISDYESMDGESVRIVFMVASRPNQQSLYIRTLSAISSVLRNATLRQSLLDAGDAEEIFSLITAGA